MIDIFTGLRAQIRTVPVVTAVGRVAAVTGGTVRIKGLDHLAAQGDRLRIGRTAGEVLQLSPDGLVALMEGPVEGLTINTKAELIGAVQIAPDNSWIGRIIDPYGRPLDDRPLLPGATPRRLTSTPPPAAQRRKLGERLETGVAVFDTLLPIVRGQRIGLFAGSGVGKSTLLAKLARGVSADITVIALIGERGRELREFTEHVLGPSGMARSVIVAATSDQSALTRRRCASTAMAVAEHFRDQGLHVLLLADSITRFAEAHREVALAAGESPALRGFPASLTQAIMGLAERAGPGPQFAGDITAIFSVLVAGSDMDEPVADIVRGVLDGHVVLDRKIAERGRFPAIDLLRSVSRSLPNAASADENHLIAEARRLLGAWERAELMVQAGLYATGSDPAIDAALRVWPSLDRFLAEDAPTDGIEGSFRRLRAALAI
jgi:flagellum-specific ATP synthase